MDWPVIGAIGGVSVLAVAVTLASGRDGACNPRAAEEGGGDRHGAAAAI